MLELRTDFCLTLNELKLAEQMGPEFSPAVLISDRVTTKISSTVVKHFLTCDGVFQFLLQDWLAFLDLSICIYIVSFASEV